MRDEKGLCGEHRKVENIPKKTPPFFFDICQKFSLTNPLGGAAPDAPKSRRIAIYFSAKESFYTLTTHPFCVTLLVVREGNNNLNYANNDKETKKHPFDDING